MGGWGSGKSAYVIWLLRGWTPLIDAFNTCMNAMNTYSCVCTNECDCDKTKTRKPCCRRKTARCRCKFRSMRNSLTDFERVNQ